MNIEIGEMNRNVEELLKEMRAIKQLLQELVSLGYQSHSSPAWARG